LCCCCFYTSTITAVLTNNDAGSNRRNCKMCLCTYEKFVLIISFKKQDVSITFPFELCKQRKGFLLPIPLISVDRCYVGTFPGFNRKWVALFEVSRASTGSGLHYFNFPGLQPGERCIISSFPGFNRKCVAYFKFPGLQPEVGCIILIFPASTGRA